jgi:hypothetical protein
MASIHTPSRQQQQQQQQQQMPSIIAAPIESRTNISMMGPAPQPQDKAIARGSSGIGASSSLPITGNVYGASLTPSHAILNPSLAFPPQMPSQSSIFPQSQQSLPQTTQQLPQEALAYAALYYYYAALAAAAGQR